MTLIDPNDIDVCPVCDTHRCPRSPLTHNVIAGAAIGAAAGLATWLLVIVTGWWMIASLM